MSMIKSYAAKEAGGELEVYEYDPGELRPQDVEVQVDYCGICHSDLSMIDNEWGFSQYPLVAGHEVIGRVVALGSAAQDKGLQVGQRVGIGWTARSCGHCDACISGNLNPKCQHFLLSLITVLQTPVLRTIWMDKQMHTATISQLILLIRWLGCSDFDIC